MPVINKITELKIKGKSGNIIDVDEAGFLFVKQAQIAPPNTFPVVYNVLSNVAGSTFSDTIYKIPVGTEIVLQQFVGGAYPSTNASRVELYFCYRDVIENNSQLLSLGYLQIMFSDVLSNNFKGDDRNCIIMRRRRLDAIAREMYAKLVGYVKYDKLSTIDGGVSTGGTNTTLTDSSKNWAVNSLSGKYLVIGGMTPLLIASNTSNKITVATGHNIFVTGAGNEYKIVEFLS